ncbi:MAG: hypothetical protein ACFB2W_18305 [Leptolyngbyaceae cyanobacterium]
MQLLICPGYHAAELTQSFLRSLSSDLSLDNVWQLPIWVVPGSLPWLLGDKNAPRIDRPLSVIAFSAGVVGAYPLVLAWQNMGGTGRLIAVDGWGMPLPGILSVYRMSHDRWTHSTTYFPSPQESKGYFYSHPAVAHLDLWQSPQQSQGFGSIGGVVRPMSALDFVGAALTAPA